ncbi:MAG: Kef-type K+ transport system membrane component KefB [Myxococcota bacterium]|jgi:Kef-type K+ transport system membrane component KefB
MKRLIVLAVALSIMWALSGLPSTVEMGVSDPLTLAAIGFVVLAAFTVGELGGRLGLPKVTGYIVAGVALGPQVASILTDTLVGELRVFNTLALGLIATTAGLELDLAAIRRVWKTLVVTVALKVPLLLLLVGGTLFGVETLWPSLGLPSEAILPVAIIVGVLGIGTSPAIALAVVNESRSKGRLTDLLLAIAVVKDLVVVVSLAIAIAVARAMLDPEASLDAHVLIHVTEELGSSMLVGGLLGGLLILYVRYIHAQMLVFVLMMILVVAELSHLLHLELLLVFIVAGFLVRNFSPYEHELLEPLERIALPVFVVFFTTAGAGVDLHATFALLPLALAIVVARLIAFFIASHAGATVGAEGPALKQNAWLTYIPQAGVTLGLVLLAAEALPSLAEPLTRIGMALVAIHLLVGPVTLGLGLRRAGETGDASAPHDAHAHGHAHGEPAPAPDGEPTPEPAAPALTEEALLAPLAGTGQEEVVAALHRAIRSELSTFAADAREILADEQVQVRELLPADGEAASLLALVAQPAPLVSRTDRAEELLSLYRRLSRHIQALPELVAVTAIPPTADQQRRSRQSSRFVRGIRWLRRIGSRRRQQRVPLRMLARTALEGRLITALLDASRERWRADAQLLETLQPFLLGRLDPTLADELLDDAAARWLGAPAALGRAVEEGFVALCADLQATATPEGLATRPRYSRIEPVVEAARAALREEDADWASGLAATEEHLRIFALIAAAQQHISAEVHAWGVEPLEPIQQRFLPLVAEIEQQLIALEQQLTALDPIERVPAMWEPLLAEVYPARRQRLLQRLGTVFRHRVQPEQLIGPLLTLVEGLPRQLRMLIRPVSAAETPDAISTTVLQPAQHLQALIGEMIPDLTRALGPASGLVASGDRLVGEGIEVAAYGLMLASRQHAEDSRADLAPLHRAIARLEDYREELEEAISRALKGLSDEQLRYHKQLDDLQDARRLSAARIRTSMASTRQSVQVGLQTLQSGLVRVRAAVEAREAALMEHPAVVSQLIQSGQRHLDAASIRSWLAGPQGIPPGMALLFSGASVDDHRLFIVHTEIVDALLANIDSTMPLTALISGERGSGRTSVLNIVQLRARGIRILRPDSGFHDRHSGLLGALAAELSCTSAPDALTAALTREPTLVLIDDLEHFVVPGPAGLQPLRETLQLIAATTEVNWIITASTAALDRLETLGPIRDLFIRHHRLQTQGWKGLQEVIATRARLGGLLLKSTPPPLRDSLLGRGFAESYFRELLKQSDGNLRAALVLHTRASTLLEEDLIVTSRPQRIKMPFFQQLPGPARAVLLQLYTFGPMSIAQLAESTGLTEPELARHLLFLRAAGLMITAPHRRNQLAIPRSLCAPLHDALKKHRLLEETRS